MERATAVTVVAAGALASATLAPAYGSERLFNPIGVVLGAAVGSGIGARRGEGPKGAVWGSLLVLGYQLYVTR